MMKAAGSTISLRLSPSSTSESVTMTVLSEFSEDEQSLIVNTPVAVLRAAIVAERRPGPVKLFRQLAAGTRMIRAARLDENPFVQSVASAIVEHSGADKVDFPDVDEVVSTVFDQAERALTLLRAKAEDDAEAYGTWLSSIAVWATEAAKPKRGTRFGRKVAVKPGEQAFLKRLTEIVEA